MIDTITQHVHLLRCPKCHHAFQLQGTGLMCTSGHTFDLSKRGYVHLLLHQVQSFYPQTLFEARKRTAQAGFFQPLLDTLSQTILEVLNQPGLTPETSLKRINLLDAGCGEGSLTLSLQENLGEHVGLCCGIDIAKEAIQLASLDASPILWTVADLANLPFRDKAFHVIVNILSPANYREFSRILTQSGFLLKVLPGQGYLKEFRRIFYDQAPKEDYSNLKTLTHFQEHMDLIHQQRLTYSISPQGTSLDDLAAMTPMLLGKSPTLEQKTALKKIQTIDLDYEILLGKPKAVRE
jgi:23S rRNA (guanine745-N1)-methyltransferase